MIWGLSVQRGCGMKEWNEGLAILLSSPMRWLIFVEILFK